jgi:DNA-binding LacI/PurR family transcriptional regulator
MKVLEEDRCEQAAILFGFIQPYDARMAFESQVLRYAEKVFGKRNNYMVVQSSEDDFSLERKIAESFVHNGIKGIILWPVNNDPNRKFFTELSRQIPVVVVDRLLEGADLPAVLHDLYQAGSDVCEHMLSMLKHRRMLVLMDNLKISPYEDFTRGLQDQAKLLNRFSDLTVLQLPLTDLIRQFNMGDFSQVQAYKTYIERIVKEGGYDVLFCLQDELIDYTIIATGLIDQLPKLQLGSLRYPGANTRSQKYNESGVLEWMVNPPKIIELAADMVQQWVLTRHMTKNVTRIKLELKTK